MRKDQDGKRLLSLALAVNTAGFALGCLGGFLLAGWFSARGWLSFDRWMESYTLGISLQGLDRISFWAAFWDCLRWPLFVWALGFTALGIWMIPVMFVLRGFCLCFSVAGLAAATQGGFLLALILLGFGDLIGLCAFFLLGIHAWDLARRQQGGLLGVPSEQGRPYCLRGSAVLLGLLLWSGLKYWLLPALLQGLLPILTAR